MGVFDGIWMFYRYLVFVFKKVTRIEPLHVYQRLEVTRKDGKSVKLRIQDARAQDLEPIMDFMSKWFIHEESLYRTAGIGNSEAALDELKQMGQYFFLDPRNYPLLCVVDHEDPSTLEVVGCNLLYYKEKGGEELPEASTKELRTLLTMSTILEREYDLFTSLEVPASLGGAGLSVHPDYRGLGLATEILRARAPMLLHRKIPLSFAWFTSLPSQRAAEKAGYMQVAELTFQELGRRSDVAFTDVPDTLQLKVLRVADENDLKT
ncbi:unnamed protein product [Plutella xylostella]|uniref:(diamondback moth) hypothetical protein n=1 Tax=Plutella xylostella TaxID=51655 RepID=A0A8S4FY13_PLUXY|nr:unnamed protein product [Plutella xylostella]